MHQPVFTNVSLQCKHPGFAARQDEEQEPN
jgi:hypothetical protein